MFSRTVLGSHLKETPLYIYHMHLYYRIYRLFKPVNRTLKTKGKNRSHRKVNSTRPKISLVTILLAACDAILLKHRFSIWIRNIFLLVTWLFSEIFAFKGLFKLSVSVNAAMSLVTMLWSYNHLDFLVNQASHSKKWVQTPIDQICKPRCWGSKSIIDSGC